MPLGLVGTAYCELNNQKMKPNSLSEAIIREQLQSIQDPYLGLDLIAAKIVKKIDLSDTKVSIVLKFGYPVQEAHPVIQTISKILEPLLGDVALQITSSWKVNPHAAQNGLKPVANIKNIIAVASGKGGVGKSTTAINLALGISVLGARVGLLDADIYGPSQPHMLGTKEKPALREDKRLEPIVKYDLQTMSMGYLVDDGPMVWRGPMVSTALQQLLNETAWDNLDYLIVDLPPGTGDIQLTLAQKIPVAAAVIVTTPQEVALLDAKKALMMFKKLGISIVGIIENMSTHICTECGHHEAIFGVGGGEKLATEFEIPLLAKLPLDSRIQQQSDAGRPSIVEEPEGSIAQLYHELALQVTAKLSLQARDYTVASPRLVE